MDTMLCYEYGTSVFEAMEAAAVQWLKRKISTHLNIHRSITSATYNVHRFGAISTI